MTSVKINNMKKNYFIIICSIIIFLLCMVFCHSKGTFNDLETNNYINEEYGISFNFPRSWGEPEVLQDTLNNKFSIDFSAHYFSLNNGYYFLENSDGTKPSVQDLLDYYQKDMDIHNEVEYYNISDIIIGGRNAVKVSVDTLDGGHHIDIYIYKEDKGQNDFYLITYDDSKINKEEVGIIISSLVFSD